MSKGYNSRAYVSAAPGAFYLLAASDFGALAPVLVTLTSQATGSVQSTVADVFFKTTWITAQGESIAGNEVSIALNSATAYGVIVQQPIVPTQGATVLGWRIYSGVVAGTEYLNTAPDTTNFSTTQGTIAAIAISSVTTATVTILVNSVSTAAAAPTVDRSGVQGAMPSVTSTAPVLYYAVVPNTGSQWKQQKSVDFMKSDGIADPASIVLDHLDYIQPVYPGASGAPAGGTNPPVSTYTQVSVLPSAYMVMNGNLFQAVQAASGSTASTFIGAAAFAVSKGTKVTDNNVTWQSLGKAGLIRMAFSNSETTAASPAVQAYEFFQH